MISREVMVKTFYQRFCRPTLKRLEDPAAAQEACLKKILNRCKDTAFGKQYGFSDITSVEEFQSRVPLTTYESMQPYINRCMQGEENVLFPDKILIFIITSGTTGVPKCFPLGGHRVEELALDGLMGSVLYIVHTGNYDVMDGAILTLTAPPRMGQKIGPYDVAFISGALTNIPPTPRMQILQTFRSREVIQRVPPREVDEIRDFDKKCYLTARYSIQADVRSAIGVTSRIATQLLKTSTKYLDRFLADSKLDEKTKKKLRKLSSDGVLNLQELWPNFRVVVSGGMSLTPYRRMIHDLLGDVDVWEQYGASEASVGLQIYPDKGIIPLVDRTFFEFIPDEEKNAAPIPLSDVKRNTPYRIIITSNGGFYRYDLGDLVTFTHLDPPVFGEISRKKALVSLLGERISEEVFLRVLERACEQHGIGFIDFALLPEVTEKVIRYHLFVEFTQPPDDIEEFSNIVDTRLRTGSFMYDFQRKQKAMSCLVIIPVQSGGFDVVLQKLGKELVQGKVPRVLTPELSRMFPQLKSTN